MTRRGLPTITEGGLTLRPLRAEDLALTRAWRNHADSRRWFNSTDEVTEEGHLAWFQSYLERHNDFVFITEADGTPIAQSALYDIADGEAEFGRLLVSPDARGRGYAHAVTALTLRCADEQLGLERVRLEVKPDNVRAIAAYVRAGFTVAEGLEGTGGATVMIRKRT